MPDYGQTITKGVKYLKINRLDKDGEDFSQRLALADNIRVNYPDVGPVQYNIITTQQQGDSYLMGIVPQEVTSSVNNIKDYSMVLDLSGTGPTIGAGTKYEQWYTGTYGSGYGMSVISGNAEGAYDNDSIFTFSTPNVLTNITSSIRTGNLGGGTSTWFPALVRIDQSGDFDKGITDGSGMYSLGPPVTLNANFTTYTTETILSNIPGGSYYFVAVFLGSTTSWQIFDLGIEVNQTTSAYTFDEVLINITPEQLNFQWSDYNAVFGNASEPQFSEVFMDVDYSGNYITPINFELLYSGSALKASVQDSNYTQRGWSNGRYDGSRNSSTDFNQ